MARLGRRSYSLEITRLSASDPPLVVGFGDVDPDYPVSIARFGTEVIS